VEAANSFPRYVLGVTEIGARSTDEGPVEVELAIEVGIEHLGMAGWSSKKRKGRAMDITTVTTYTSDLDLIDFRRIP
jgi:ATP-dependent DNA helicase HFM1/MER3